MPDARRTAERRAVISRGPQNRLGGAVAQVVERATHNRVVGGSSPPGTTMVAVSGGPDSTALLVALHEAGHQVVAAHYDHALREDSANAARQVAELCARLGIPLVAERRAEPMPAGSLQAAARKLRYAFLERARLEAGAEVVALAHTADDVVEGAVIHLLRGCGIAGLRGMPARRGHFVRPLLNVWRKDVLAFLHARGLETYPDPANDDLRFARARVRHVILPALERDRPGITRRLFGAATAASGYQEMAEKAPTAVEKLKALYAEAGGQQPGLSRRNLEAMLSLTKPGRGGRGVDLPGGLRFRIVGELMQVVRKQPQGHQPPRLHAKNCSGCDETGAAHLQAGLSLRVGYRTPGLRMRPVGGVGSRKLQDIFVDARVPREERDAWPLVFAGDRLAWVPGVALDMESAGRRGEPGLHVTITPMPVNPAPKVARLENPPGDQI
jgi:tRNA(Ile)-lysidine synthase